jgi:hypothetical protein
VRGVHTVQQIHLEWSLLRAMACSFNIWDRLKPRIKIGFFWLNRIWFAWLFQGRACPGWFAVVVVVVVWLALVVMVVVWLALVVVVVVVVWRALVVVVVVWFGEFRKCILYINPQETPTPRRADLADSRHTCFSVSANGRPSCLVVGLSVGQLPGLGPEVQARRGAGEVKQQMGHLNLPVGGRSSGSRRCS